ncbi:hypothetical protein AOQ71_07945 [Bradyrhizobium manausense]|uniref:Uncharacterized protein n=1 Tax=Bradyrhizobium manausense TaxID=989370 RepID=A0A0R3E0U6_9BRAD|nr:hypothetical protein AOQ71_07945 [Bradyrhizobium manausense]
MWDLHASVLAAAAAGAGAAHTQKVNVAQEDAVDAAIRRSIDDLGGRLDILVASVGVTGLNGAVKGYPGSDWRKVFDVNVKGAFYCNRAARWRTAATVASSTSPRSRARKATRTLRPTVRPRRQ